MNHQWFGGAAKRVVGAVDDTFYLIEGGVSKYPFDFFLQQ